MAVKRGGIFGNELRKRYWLSEVGLGSLRGSTVRRGRGYHHRAAAHAEFIE
jgi:hypothetical protein